MAIKSQLEMYSPSRHRVRNTLSSSPHSNSRHCFSSSLGLFLPIDSNENLSARLGEEKDYIDAIVLGRNFFLFWWRAMVFVTLQGSMMLVGSLSFYPLFGSKEIDTHKEARRLDGLKGHRRKTHAFTPFFNKDRPIPLPYRDYKTAKDFSFLLTKNSP